MRVVLPFAAFRAAQAGLWGKFMRRTVVLLIVLVTAACAGPQYSSHKQGRAELGSWGFDIAGMDASMKPGDDFFRYANGTWYNAAVIPPERANIGSFTSDRKSTRLNSSH